MRLLIGASPHRLPYVGRLAGSLSGLGVECRTVDDSGYDGYPGSDVGSWLGSGRRFGRLVSDFGPDVILSDRVRGFAHKAVNSGIPTVIHLRGDYWEGIDWERRAARSPARKWALGKWMEIGEECLSKAAMIMPICGYLEGIARKRHPGSPMRVLRNFADASVWSGAEPMDLEHPCVGLLQEAGAWEKAREMLLLEEILPALPDVTFYWAGGGRFAGRIAGRLERFPNFRRLGPLEYPGRVREYLAGIDVYALITGIDMSPSSLLEAQLMGRPALASDVGGIPESVPDSRSLVPAGSGGEWAGRIRRVLGDPGLMREMGERGRRFAGGFGPDVRARELLGILEGVAGKRGGALPS